MGQAKRRGSYTECRAQALQAREPERTQFGPHHRRTVTHPNDPKLSDSRSWRAGCMAGERRRQEAASVTAERVRCSAC